MAQSSFVQTPPKHPREQQSCAVAQATPSARHASRHWMTPACPVTGSHSPLQQSGPVVQVAAGAPQLPPALASPPAGAPPSTAPMHALLAHVPEQQSKPAAHEPPAPLQALVGATPGAVPSAPLAAVPPHTFPVQAPTQQSEADTQPAPMLRQDAAPSTPAKVEPIGEPAPPSPRATLELLPPQQSIVAAAAAKAAVSKAFGPMFVDFMRSSVAWTMRGEWVITGTPSRRPRRIESSRPKGTCARCRCLSRSHPGIGRPRRGSRRLRCNRSRGNWPTQGGSRTRSSTRCSPGSRTPCRIAAARLPAPSTRPRSSGNSPRHPAAHSKTAWTRRTWRFRRRSGPRSGRPERLARRRRQANRRRGAIPLRHRSRRPPRRRCLGPAPCHHAWRWRRPVEEPRRLPRPAWIRRGYCSAPQSRRRHRRSRPTRGRSKRRRTRTLRHTASIRRRSERTLSCRVERRAPADRRQLSPVPPWKRPGRGIRRHRLHFLATVPGSPASIL